VLFRGGKEKEIRMGILKDKVLEGIISLPSALFYGTGIPACILLINKNKPDELRDKVFFINADREYAEGKNQNMLRPEDIEKMDHVLTNKLEVPKYSRLVDLDEIETHDFNLNIRRYVDNTADPEPVDVRAHLLGGVPVAEISVKSDIYQKFGFNPAKIFSLYPPSQIKMTGGDKGKGERGEGDVYTSFDPEITLRDRIREKIEQDESLLKVFAEMQKHLSSWWEEARHDFAELALVRPETEKDVRRVSDAIILHLSLAGKKVPKVRKELLDSLKAHLAPLGVLNGFQVAGVFVNWWDSVKYDLKTIMNIGWSPSLIPDDYMLRAFFMTEQEALESLEGRIADYEGKLAEAVEETRNILEYEADEGEEITAKLMKVELKSAIRSLSEGEKETYKKMLDIITDLEKVVKDTRKEIKDKEAQLMLKIEVKQFGIDDQKNEYLKLSIEIEEKLSGLPEGEKKKRERLKKDYAAVKRKLDGLRELIESVGGVITEKEARDLILQKHHDIISDQLMRYLNTEKRALIGVFENLYDKYAVSSETLEQEREKTLAELNGFLKGMKYLG
jgi:type I restriction enzyme M protein